VAKIILPCCTYCRSEYSHALKRIYIFWFLYQRCTRREKGYCVLQVAKRESSPAVHNSFIDALDGGKFKCNRRIFLRFKTCGRLYKDTAFDKRRRLRIEQRRDAQHRQVKLHVEDRAWWHRQISCGEKRYLSRRSHLRRSRKRRILYYYSIHIYYHLSQRREIYAFDTHSHLWISFEEQQETIGKNPDIILIQTTTKIIIQYTDLASRATYYVYLYMYRREVRHTELVEFKSERSQRLVFENWTKHRRVELQAFVLYSLPHLSRDKFTVKHTLNNNLFERDVEIHASSLLSIGAFQMVLPFDQ